MGIMGLMISSAAGTWVGQTSGTSSELRGLAHGNGTFVAVGDAGAVLTSVDDGGNWTAQHLGTALNAVTFGNGSFVAVGDNGVVRRSTNNGASWSESFLGTAMHGVAFGNNTFVAVGDLGVIRRSVNNGVSWTESFLGTAMRGVAFGNNTFVAVGDNGVVRRSTNNGTSWTENFLGGQWRGIAFGNGIFVAVGGNGLLKWSDDNGLTWNDPTSPSPWPGGEMYGVAHGAGRFVAVGLNSLIWESGLNDVTSWSDTYPGGQFKSAGFGGDTFVVGGMLGVVYTQEVVTPGIAPAALAFPAAGGSGTVNVTMPPATGWTATSSAPSWLHITSGASGTGSGTIEYDVDPNPNSGARNASVTVAGLTHAVNQAGQTFSYSIVPSLATYQFPGGSGSIAVTATPGAPWSAVASRSWITITSGGSGSGSGTVNYSVGQNNSGGFRSGTITIAGQVCTIEQDPASYVLAPPSASFGYSGGAGSFSVQTSSGAPWSVGSNAGWVTITSGSGPGPGTVNYSVDENNTRWSRTATLTVAGQTHVVQQEAPVFSISPSSRGFGSSSGSGTITVTASPGLSWTAGESLGWVNITSGASGTGNGTVTYTVATNGGGSIRSGNISVSIGGSSLLHEVSQAPAGYDISPYSRSFAAWSTRPLNEGSITVTVPSGIPWSASTVQSWITILSGSSGTGSGTITYRVANNSSLDPRNGRISIGGSLGSVQHVVSQAGATFSVSPLTVNMDAAGGAAGVAVTATTGVSWTAVSNAGWITITAGASGTGSGTVGFNVATNTSASSRVGTITVGGESVSVSQAGVTPSFSISPYQGDFGSAGGPGNVAVTGTSGVAWTSQSHAAWIAITSGGSGSGNGMLYYSVASNPSTSARVGTLTVAGETHTVNQAGLNPYGVLPSSQSYTAGGGTLSVNVTASGGASWTAVSESPWLHVTSMPPSGSGNGAFAYSVDTNTHVDARSGRIRVGSSPHFAYHDVNQSGASASYSISPTSASISGWGGGQDVSVSATTGAAWSASSPVAWITYLAGTDSGVGSGVASYVVEPNATTSSRGATLTIAGKAHSVTQEAGDTPGSCVLSPSSVWENQPVGTVVGTLSTTSYVPISSPTYELHSFPGIDDNGFFSISGDQLLTAAGLDADVRHVYYVGVRVGNGHGGHYTGIVVVFVTDDWLEDADADGLPEEDEQLHGTSDLVADTDGDGLSDGDEINVTGTDPLDAASNLVISWMDVHGNTTDLGWESVSGKTYHVMSSSGLEGWATNPSNQVQATSSWTVFPFDNGANQKQFYHLAMFPPRVEEITKLLRGDGEVEDRFGEKISIDGDTLVVGAKFEEEAGEAGNYNAGAAFVFQRDQGGPDNWGFVRKLLASDRASGDQFGYSVDINADTIVVGAKFDDGHRGAAYVFERNQGGTNNWGEVKKLVASDGAGSDIYGFEVVVRGDRIVVGSVWDDSRRGAAYLYERNAGGANNWGEVKKLVASDREEIDEFGWAVGMAGDTIAVGSHFEDERGANAGAVYLFERNQGGAGNWGQVRKIVASDGQAGDQFGTHLRLQGDRLVISAPTDDDRAYNAGAVYILERNAGGAGQWGEGKKVHAPDGVVWDVFGGGMDLDGDRLLVGAWAKDLLGNASGSAYLFHRNQNGPDRWGLVQRFEAADGEADANFGWRVGISGPVMAIGTPGDDENGSYSGACYIFREVTP